MISTRDLVLAFVLAKVCGIAVAFLLLGSGADGKYLALLADTVSFLILVTFISVTAKRPPLSLLREQPYDGVWRGRWWCWALAAIPIGFFIRFSSEGIVLFAMGIYDPELPYKEFSDVLTKPEYMHSWMMLLAFFSWGRWKRSSHTGRF